MVEDLVAELPQRWVSVTVSVILIDADWTPAVFLGRPPPS